MYTTIKFERPSDGAVKQAKVDSVYPTGSLEDNGARTSKIGIFSISAEGVCERDTLELALPTETTTAILMAAKPSKGDKTALVIDMTSEGQRRISDTFKSTSKVLDQTVVWYSSGVVDVPKIDPKKLAEMVCH